MPEIALISLKERTSEKCSLYGNTQCIECIKNHGAIRLLFCSDYYEWLHSFSSDKIKYGIITECNNVSILCCRLMINVEIDIQKYVLKTFMHNFLRKVNSRQSLVQHCLD